MSAGEKTMLEHHLDRLKQAGYPVIVATTSNGIDDPIVGTAMDRDVSFFRGSEHDVLSRYALAANKHDLDVVVRVTSDCPLVDPNLVADGIEKFLSIDDPYAHVSNVIERTFPRGFDFEVFSTEVLAEAHASATTVSDREHVTPWIYNNRSGKTRLISVRRMVDASQYRITLDTMTDLTVIRALIENHGAAQLGADEIISVLERHPDIACFNSNVEQKIAGQ